jgi:hypothetical protein
MVNSAVDKLLKPYDQVRRQRTNGQCLQRHHTLIFYAALQAIASLKLEAMEAMSKAVPGMVPAWKVSACERCGF